MNKKLSLSPHSYFRKKLYNPLIFKKPDRRKKISNDDFIIPSYSESENIISINYNVSQLKKIARCYKQKVSGNKSELVNRIYNYLKYSFNALIIQKIYRGYLRRLFNSLRGPARFDRKCTNVVDFLTLSNLSNTPYHQFFSFKDKDGFIYGFDIKSLYNLLKKSRNPKNPYNRNSFSKKVINDVNYFIKLGNILKEDIKISIKDDTSHLSEEKMIQLKALSLFQKIDSFGHITDANWFLNLNRSLLDKFLRELCDIWNYRAQLTLHTKHLICPPNGNPFIGTHVSTLINRNITVIKKTILNIIENMILKSPDKEYQSLGAFYVLAALTLVSNPAADTLPWLYQSVVY